MTIVIQAQNQKYLSMKATVFKSIFTTIIANI